MTDHLHNLGPFSDRPELDIMAFRFFKLFSRMEYAIKAAKMFENGRATADWKTFGNEIHEAFSLKRNTEVQLREAYKYVMERPPLKQSINDGQLVWVESTPDAQTDTALVLQYVCRVRNNLFHGGKFSSGWLDPERSERLLSHALLILEACIDIPSVVANAYES